MTEGVKDKYTRLIEGGLCVQKRWGLPEDVGKVVGALVSGSFSYSTGPGYHGGWRHDHSPFIKIILLFKSMKTSRRNFIVRSMLASAGITAGLNAISQTGRPGFKLSELAKSPAEKDQKPFPLSIFSKQLQWLDYDEMARVAAEIGFDGVDLTVRPRGTCIARKS